MTGDDAVADDLVVCARGSGHAAWARVPAPWWDDDPHLTLSKAYRVVTPLVFEDSASTGVRLILAATELPLRFVGHRHIGVDGACFGDVLPGTYQLWRCGSATGTHVRYLRPSWWKAVRVEAADVTTDPLRVLSGVRLVIELARPGATLDPDNPTDGELIVLEGEHDIGSLSRLRQRAEFPNQRMYRSELGIAQQVLLEDCAAGVWTLLIRVGDDIAHRQVIELAPEPIPRIERMRIAMDA